MTRKSIQQKISCEFISEIAAHPGYFVLEPYSKNGKVVDVFFHPIYAWAIEAQTFAPYPIINFGVQIEKLYILRPDGIIHMGFEDGQYDSVDEWLIGINAVGAVLHQGKN